MPLVEVCRPRAFAESRDLRSASNISMKGKGEQLCGPYIVNDDSVHFVSQPHLVNGDPLRVDRLAIFFPGTPAMVAGDEH